MVNRSPLLNVIFQSLNNVTRNMLRDFGEIENLQVSPNSLEEFVSKTENKISTSLLHYLKKSRPEWGIKFNNDTELKSVGSYAFQATSKSGLQVLGAPLEGNFGEIMSGALESSNTDITNEMVSMMRTQQAFNGNARIMQTSVDITRRLME